MPTVIGAERPRSTRRSRRSSRPTTRATSTRRSCCSRSRTPGARAPSSAPPSDRFYRKRGYAIAAGFWINTFPFDRGGGQRRGLAAAAAHLRDGRNVLLFPQGTRGAGPEGYRAGVAELALTAGAPIIPVHIEGSRS